MKILHLTDFHFSNQEQDLHRQTKVVNKMIEHIKFQSEKPDLIFFTGDLVYSGDKIESFRKAKELLIDPLLKDLDIPLENFFICPGNHDVDRSKRSMATIRFIDTIKDNIELDKFTKDPGIDYSNSLLPLNNYYTFTEELKSNSKDIYKNGYSCHLRTIENKTIGIYCANTAWRAVGHNDEGNLVLPLKFINEGLHHLKDAQIKIILHHHPLSNFKLYNEYALEDVIHNNFNIAFSGHLHKDTASVFLTHTDGILKLQSAASLAGTDGSTIGYTVINVDNETYFVKGKTFKFNNEGEYFYDGNLIEVQIPVSKEKQEQNKFRQRLRELHDLELEEANDLFLNGKVNKDAKGFLDLWTTPVISSKSPEEVKKENSVPIFNCDDFVNSGSDFLIMGEDKSGKTSLLKYLQLQCLSKFPILGVIPFYINSAKAEKGGDVKSRTQKEVATYFATSRAGATSIMETQKTLVLIDNLDLTNEQERKWLEEIIKCFHKSQIIICCNQNSLTKYRDVSIGDKKMINIFFHSLKKKQIREIAEKFYGNSNSKTEVITRINHIFNMLAIPFNFWNVSLFMWVFKESNRDINNDVDLVDLYMESILERENLLRSKGEFSYDKYKQYLAHLARFFLKKQDTSYSASIPEIYAFTEEYLKENPRNHTNANTVWSYVENKGIVKEVYPGMYSFRLNGIFEYFLAHYLKLNSEFRNNVIDDNDVYLSFKNELEMYAGSNRSDEDFVERIFNKTQRIFNNIHFEYSVNGGLNMDSLLKSIATDDIALHLGKKEMEVINERLSQDEIDDFEDPILENGIADRDRHCEVRVKKLIPIDEEDVASLERALYILGRVFKNADDIKNGNLINNIFNYLLDTTVMWGFKLFESMRKETNNPDNNNDHITMLANLMKQLLPVIVQSRLSDMIGAVNMQSVIKKKIESISLTDEKDSQFKLFLLFYMLCDIDLSSNIRYIEKSVQVLKIPILKHSIMIKILYYYHFRISEIHPQIQKATEKTLQNLYSEVAKSFNSSLYSKNQVSQIFNKLDKKKMVEKKKNS
ncbi:metallophosphoesterase [Adhaeribacter soli]|uniref:Uncharacterized protein n=1 Tax=Adhaeribacter soli TaxID=2607655 RepID=A0A5N1IKK4_9BACT|nr:metallophosphoesterase [Adhaeribacter soli]KAA9325636.1 hypothetical protein F0P94_17010 [Adhaeribacter soli]